MKINILSSDHRGLKYENAAGGVIKGKMNGNDISLPAWVYRVDRELVLAFATDTDDPSKFTKVAMAIPTEELGQEVELPKPGHLEVRLEGKDNFATRGNLLISHDPAGKNYHGRVEGYFSNGDNVKSLVAILSLSYE
ncbi:hypothetical protein QS468_20700 [Bacillus subtilis]|nr:hypothetical protein [Pseudomonas sp. A29(2023)]MDL5595148.1 hypothetical protein [Bacillus subtilis]